MTIGTPVTLGTGTGVNVSVITVTLGTAIVAGDLVVVGVLSNMTSTDNVSSIVDGGGNSYFRAVQSGTGNANTNSEIWYAQNATAVTSGTTLTATMATAFSGGFGGAVAAARVTGIAASPLDRTNSIFAASASSVSFATGQLTIANEIVFGTSGCVANVTYSGASGFTNIAGVLNAAAFGLFEFDYQIVSSTATVTYTPVFSGSGRMAACVASFEAASTASGFLFDLANPMR